MKKYRLLTGLLILLSFSVFAEEKKLLIIADTWPQMDVLAEGLMKHGDYIINKANEDEIESDLSAFNFVFMYIHKTISPRTERALIDYTMNGGSLIVLHHGISSSNMKNPQWLDFLGIELFPRDHQEYPWGVLANLTYSMVNLYPGHFITSNGIKYEKTTTFNSEYDSIYVGEFRAFQLINTELFLNQRFKKDDQRTILFGFRTEDGSRSQPTSGWYSQKGKGRVFYYQPGHAVSDYMNPNFLKILLNTLEWEPELTNIPWDVSNSNSLSCYDSSLGRGGWKNILPDEDFKGWTELPWPPGSQPDEKFKQQWFISDSTLLCTSKQGHSHLVSDEQFRNFVLHVEWRYLPEEGSQNSGIFVRMKPGQYVMHQCELKNSKVRLFGGILSDSAVTLLNSVEPSESGEWTQGVQHVPKDWSALYKVKNYPQISAPTSIGKCFKRRILPVGEWNTTEILCQNQFIVIWNNGAICSFTDNCTVMEGSIGFESEGHAIEFRKMFVREL